MAFDITKVRETLGRKFRGASLDDVSGVSDYSIFGEAAVNLLSELSPQETVRKTTLNIFSGVYSYDPADDVKSIVDIRPQTTTRSVSDNPTKRFSEDFDREKNDNEFTLEFEDGTKILRYSKDSGNSLNITETIDDNWTAGTGVSNIVEDTIVFAENNRSLRFDVSSGSNLITWNGDAVVDLTDHENKASLFLWVYCPDSSLITSLTLRIGSDGSNYFSITGAIHFGSLRSGWNLYRFDWNGASETGTATITDIDYVRLALVTTSADTDIRIGILSSKLPTPREYLYHSNFLFRSTAGIWLDVPTADTDIVNLDTDAENLFIHECCVLISDGLTRVDDAQKYYNKLYGTGQRVGGYERYKSLKPPEGIKTQNRWRRFGYNKK